MCPITSKKIFQTIKVSKISIITVLSKTYFLFSSTISTFQDKWLRSEKREEVEFDYEKYKKGVWTVEDYTNSSYLGDLSQEHFFDLLTPKLTEILRKKIVKSFDSLCILSLCFKSGC